MRARETTAPLDTILLTSNTVFTLGATVEHDERTRLRSRRSFGARGTPLPRSITAAGSARSEPNGVKRSSEIALLDSRLCV
jgi:hypothetical protein